MTALKSAEVATVIRILLTMLLGLWMAIGPGVRVATATDAPPEYPATAGPIFTDTCIPIEEHHASLGVLWALAVYTANFSQNWRPVSTKGDLYTFSMPVKFTYGPAKKLHSSDVSWFLGCGMLKFLEKLLFRGN